MLDTKVILALALLLGSAMSSLNRGSNKPEMSQLVEFHHRPHTTELEIFNKTIYDDATSAYV